MCNPHYSLPCLRWRSQALWRGLWTPFAASHGLLIRLKVPAVRAHPVHAVPQGHIGPTVDDHALHSST
jgi:hypothetical protein